MRRQRNLRPISKFFRAENPPRSLVLSDAKCQEESACDGINKNCRIRDNEFRWHVISSYERVLEGCSSPIERECGLPFSKHLIRRAICQELLETSDTYLRSRLEVAYAQLESFVSADEFQVIEDFKMAGCLAEEMASSGDPNDIIASARILKGAMGDRAVRIEEKISNKMRRRLEQIRSIGMSVVTMELCGLPLGV